MTNYFATLTPYERQQMAKKGGDTKRTPEVDHAWSQQELLQQLHYGDGLPVKQLAELYNISLRTMYRIIRQR